MGVGTGVPTAGPESPRPHSSCPSPAPAALEPRTLRTRRDTQGSRGSRAGQRFVPGKGCRRERVFTSVHRPQWKCWVPTWARPSTPAHTPFGLWNFRISILLNDTFICSRERVYWAEEMENLGPDSHLPTLRKSQKAPTMGIHPATQLPRDGRPSLLMVALWKTQPRGALWHGPPLL